MQVRNIANLLLWTLACPGFLLAQNVGIGTNNPLSKLHVQSLLPQDGIRIENTAQTGDPVVQFALSGQAVFTLGVDDSDGDKFKIGSSNLSTSTAMTIQRNGYVGFGSSSPDYNAHFEYNRPSNYIAYFRNQNNAGPALGAYAYNTYNAIGGVVQSDSGIAVYGVHLPSTGNGWGVWGASNSSNGIGVRGTVPITGQWLGCGGYFSGSLVYANGLYALSDGRMKRDVQPLEGALDKVGRLRGVSYKYNAADYPEFVGQDQRTYIGFVAQEVEAVLPEAVAEKYLLGETEGGWGPHANGAETMRQTVKVVDYVSLVPLLVEAIKEQQAYILQLEERVKTLENR